jgi:uncharacterized protein (DUF952 family)
MRVARHPCAGDVNAADDMSDTQTVYKILRDAEWREAERSGVFRGSADDTRDGFIHLSTAEQTVGTFEKYFAGESGLMLLAVKVDAVRQALKWEPSRGGAFFTFTASCRSHRCVGRGRSPR